MSKIILIQGQNRRELLQIGGGTVTESVDGEQVLTFTVLPDDIPYVSDSMLVEFENQLYDVRSLKRYGTALAQFIDVECDHVSYRLNQAEYDVSSMVLLGSASAVLTGILRDTPFTAGTAGVGMISEPTVVENASRRAALNLAAELLGVELYYSGWEIGFTSHRGRSTPIRLTEYNIVADISVYRRIPDQSVQYDISLLSRAYGNNVLTVGDEVQLVDQALGISTTSRIISMTRNPYDNHDVRITVGDYVPDIVDSYVDMRREALYKSEANAYINRYVSSAEGRAAIEAAVEGQFVTVDVLDNYATVQAVASISADISSIESDITLSTDFSRSTIGTNVAALLQMVSNANSSAIRLKADYIEMTGTTRFLSGDDLGAGGTTQIDGGRITTGRIAADRIDAEGLKVTTIYSAASGQEDIPVFQTGAIYMELGYNVGAPRSGEVDHYTTVYADVLRLYSPFTDTDGEFEVSLTARAIYAEGFRLYLSPSDYIYVQNNRLYFNSTRIA